MNEFLELPTLSVAFCRDVLGVRLVELAPGFAWRSELEDSSQFEIVGPPDTIMCTS